MAGVWRLLLARPDAVPAARHALAALDLDESAGPTVELLTTELVANAVKHGARDPYESILVHATCEHDHVFVRVCGEGGAAAPSGPEVKDAGPFDTSGRGLAIVDALATRWGARPRRHGLRLVRGRGRGGRAAAPLARGYESESLDPEPFDAEPPFEAAERPPAGRARPCR